ncbi:MAG TPA: ATP-binding protein [Bacteroidales bacterium]|nr:ATP-binding protein [Bacteroidales bacterium]
MNLPEKISNEFYKDLIANNTRMHSALLFFNGSDIDSEPKSMTRIAKTICAVANSGGGDIIYGIYPKRGRAVKFDAVTKFNKTTEWLFHEIQSQIDRPIKDLIIDISEIDNNPSSKIIHIQIPSNNDQPHMFSDSRYYKWQKNKFSVLDESEVRMLYGKLSACELEFLGIYNTNGLPVLNAGKYTAMSFYPKLLIRNAGNIVEKDYKIEISFPAKLYEESFQPLQALFIRHEGSHVVFGNTGNHPLFQQEISTMIEAKIAVNTENIDVFLKEYMNITLYFSNGIKKHSLKLSDTLTYNGKTIRKEDFTNIRTLTMEL